MTPNYQSVTEEKARRWSNLFFNKCTLFGLLGLFLFGYTPTHAQVVISEVFADGSFELKNTGTDNTDISGYWICNFPAYRALNTLTIDCGDLDLSAGEAVTFSTPDFFKSDDDELGLYSRGGTFGVPDNIVSYVDWGTSGGGRSGVAMTKGIWDGNAVASFLVGQSIKVSGDGSEASDWGLNESPSKCATIGAPADQVVNARYRVTFNAAWSAATHPTDFPSNPHFSGLIGLTHNNSVKLFETGQLASAGIVSMAETGSKSPLTSEIQSLITSGSGGELLSGGGISNSPGSVSFEFDISSSHPLVSLTSMIAPSPDWFVAVRDVDLYANNAWVNSASIEVSNYDSGSDSGASFASANQATDPRENITTITDGPLVVNGSIPSMGTITFTRIDMDTMCTAMGGTLTGGPFTFCVDGERDTIAAGSITLSGNSGANNRWVVTDDAGNILGLPMMPSMVNFDDAGPGVCFVWNLAFEDGLTGLAAGNNVSQLSGCFNLSNSIMVTRNEPQGGTLTGGPFTFCVDGEADNIPAGSITLSGNSGANNRWVVTDDAGNILGLPAMPSMVNFDDAGPGVCFVWNLAFEDGLTGLVAGNNVSQLSGCFNLSNSIMVMRNEPQGGTLAGGPFTFCVDGEPDNIPTGGITLTGNTGGNSQWVITDEAGTI
ncbi:MAG: spondin domain-containing protein, partial [Bacteroidota bacterium]